MRTFVYVDGFNLFYGALKGGRHKWLDLVALSRQLVPSSYDILKIKYFTARVSGASDPDSPKRQQIYLNALATLPEVEVHFGNFLSKTIRRPSVMVPIGERAINLTPDPVTLPSGTHMVDFGNGDLRSMNVGKFQKRGARRHGPVPVPPSSALHIEVHTMEEKGSDVNLAAHLLNDAWKDLYEAAVVISNDTDLVTPIRTVAVERKRQVFVVAPGKFGVSKPLQHVATFQRHIHPGMIASSQLQDPIPNTTIRRPADW